MTSLRAMTISDLPRVLEIIGEAQAFLAAQNINQWQNGYPNEETMRSDIEKEQSYVSTVDNQTVGMMTIVFDGEPSYRTIYDGAWSAVVPYACIHRMAIGGSFRGGKTADEMIRAAEALVIKKGFRYIRVDTHRENQRMQRMLFRNRFLRCGVIYLSEGLEANDERIAFDKVLV